MNFIETNLNPTGKRVNDCVVRAIMKATNYTWRTVYAGLTGLGNDLYRLPNEKEVYHLYLKQLGWEKQPMPRHENRKRYTVIEFAAENPVGTFVISVANHLTVLVDGNLYDTWNCSRKCLGNYWKRK